MNLERAEATLNFCLRHGVREVVLCAGARNAPLIELISEIKGLRTWSFFEERAAGFFALGRIEQSGAPVAVLTTSGTAVAELLPACIESFYQGRPLIILSADRPSRFRGTGSPQSIEQKDLFGGMVEKCVDIESDLSVLTSFAWSRLRPLHLNLCLEEPQSHRPSIEALQAAARSCEVVLREKIDLTPTPSVRSLRLEALDAGLFQRPLVVVGPVARRWREQVLEFLKGIPAPIYAESTSGLNGVPGLADRLLFSEDLAQAALSRGLCDSVLRVGSVPTLRLWRDLEEKRRDIPVLNLVPPEASWSGLGRKNAVWNRELGSLSSLKLKLSGEAGIPAGESLAELVEASRKSSEFFGSLVERFPASEMALVAALSQRTQNFRVYIGNSLPIREWDWISWRRGYQDIFANRGANGIDGQVITSLGWSEGEKSPALTLVGDLTALYDLASLAVSPQLSPGCRHVVIMNNGGGMIFRRIFPNPNFLNTHETSFQGWAQMFGWNYRLWKSTTDFPADLEQVSGFFLTELRPDAHQSAAFQKEWADWIQREVWT